MKKHQTFLSSDHVHTIHLVTWKPTHNTPPKAILQVVHGMAEYIERYHEFAEFLNRHNILVVGHDHLGHGQSVSQDDPHYGYFSEGDSMAHLIADTYQVTTKVKADYPQTPYFILGHSMGSFITRNYLKSYSNEVNGAIIMGTGGPVLASQLVRPLTFLLNHYIPTKPNISLDSLAFGAFGDSFPDKEQPMNWLSLNQTNVTNYLADPLLGFTFTNNGFHTLFKLSGQANKRNWYKTIRKDLPILLISGEDDPVGQFGKGPANIAGELMNKGFKEVNLILYPKLRHEILNEESRHLVMRDIAAWLNERS